MIAGFLELIGDIKMGWANFRDSNVGIASGLGFASEKDSVAARVSAGRWQNAGYKFGQQPSFSSQIDAMLKEAEQRREGNPGRGLAGFAGDIGEGIAKRIGMAARTAKDFSMSALGGIGSARGMGQQFLAQLPFLAGQKAAMDFANRPSGVNQNSLSLADANSREGFSQRVAAMRATENIGKNNSRCRSKRETASRRSLRRSLTVNFLWRRTSNGSNRLQLAARNWLRRVVESLCRRIGHGALRHYA